MKRGRVEYAALMVDQLFVLGPLDVMPLLVVIPPLDVMAPLEGFPS